MDTRVFIMMALVVSAVSGAHKPKFVCNNTMAVRYLQENVYIRCPVYANPDIDNFRIFWVPCCSTGENITIEENQSDSLLHAYIENGTSTSEKILTLKIDRIFKQYFNTYYFEAENQLGNTIHSVELINKSPSSGSQRVVLCVPLMWAMALAFRFLFPM